MSTQKKSSSVVTAADFSGLAFVVISVVAVFHWTQNDNAYKTLILGFFQLALLIGFLQTKVSIKTSGGMTLSICLLLALCGLCVSLLAMRDYTPMTHLEISKLTDSHCLKVGVEIKVSNAGYFDRSQMTTLEDFCKGLEKMQKNSLRHINPA